MSTATPSRGLSLLIGLMFALSCALSMAADPLPSWNAGEAKSALTAFVTRVTKEGGPDFVPVPERIATFDNDGTLWSEQPLYFQAIFALDQVRAMAAEHPEWKTTEPFKSAVAGDVEGLMSQGLDKALPVLLAPHSGMTADAFAQSVRDWLATAKHPQSGMPYTKMVFQPMLELLDYLRANDFKVYIVSGGGIDFLRVFAEEVYGIPPEQVVGTTLESTFEMQDGIPAIVKTEGIVLVDDKAGKPVGIYRHIGRRPILAAGNSDGDLQMLQYTTIPRGKEDTSARLGLIVHHTDGEREFAYDRDSHVGGLDKALSEADQRGWLVVDMKRDWEQVYPD
jgi:phosphoglycolate phosphatase-like HAD superfamily hydrolase